MRLGRCVEVNVWLGPKTTACEALALAVAHTVRREVRLAPDCGWSAVHDGVDLTARKEDPNVIA